MRTGGMTIVAAADTARADGSLARRGGRYSGRPLAISHEGLTGYCARNGYIRDMSETIGSSSSSCLVRLSVTRVINVPQTP